MDGVASPAFTEPYGNYRLVADADRDRAWWSMVQPGASGVGLHLATALAPQCCGGYGYPSYRAEWENESTLWHYPVFVEWVSLTDPVTKRMYSDLYEDYSADDLVAPMVGVTAFYGHAEMRYTWEQTFLPEQAEGEIHDVFEYQAGLLNFIIPAWEVVPISSRFAADLNTAIQNIPASVYGAELMDYCWCSLQDSECGHMKELEDGTEEYVEMKPDCDYVYGQDKCSCGLSPAYVQLFDALYTSTPSLLGHLQYPLDVAVARGIQGHREAWELIHQRATRSFTQLTESDLHCYISFLQQHSPYSHLYGPDAQITRRLLSSTNSATQQAS